MKLTSYINNHDDFELLLNQGIEEVILAPKELSRKGKLSLEQVHQIFESAKEHNIRCILEWDILINESEVDEQIQFFKVYAGLSFDGVRVQDPGALEFLLSETTFQIQWITEHGNHNCLGLQSWIDYIGNRLDRLVISNELSFEKLKSYQQDLKVEIEILVLGKILLFYTPRSLLRPVFQDHDDDQKQEVQAIADSEESPHKGFHIVENRHGTFMYHLKDLCLLNESQKLTELGESFWGRIEMLFHDNFSLLSQAVKIFREFNELDWAEFKKSYPVGLTKGFFLTNKTNVLFPKLKNYRLLRSDSSYIGEVVDVVKGEYIVFFQKSRSNLLQVGLDLQSTSPEGKVTEFQVQEIQTLSGNEVDGINGVMQGQHYLLRYRKGITPKTVINLASKS